MVTTYSNDSQRLTTKDTNTTSGMNVLPTIIGPTAATMAYGLNKKEVVEATFHL